MAIRSSSRRVASARIAVLTADLLEASTLCAIATVDRRGRSYINTAYFAWAPDFEIVWLSEPRAEHSKNLSANASAAIAVFDTTQTWGNPDRGIQLFGRAPSPPLLTTTTRAGSTSRASRAAETDLGAYRLYRFHAGRLKLFDEIALGGGTFVRARVGRDRKPVWEKTIAYQSKSA